MLKIVLQLAALTHQCIRTEVSWTMTTSPFSLELLYRTKLTTNYFDNRNESTLNLGYLSWTMTLFSYYRAAEQ